MLDLKLYTFRIKQFPLNPTLSPDHRKFIETQKYLKNHIVLILEDGNDIN